ncbi:MAG TPA: DUF362 domain-containing protein [Firmicutes bacterium]|nr:DUF362 domain-containing protein [Bacillota bacterium]
MPVRPIVSIALADCYDDAVLSDAVSRLFADLHINEKIRPDMRVLLKPNLLMKRKPEEATTTHPVLVEVVIRELQQHGITKITIADSPGGPYTAAMLKGIYAVSGMEAVAQRTGVCLNEDLGYGVRKNPDGITIQEFTLIRPVLEADFIIDLPKLKTHGMTVMSGAVKNLFGTIPGLMKPEMHMRLPERERFASMLVDLCETVRPGLSICDAVISMEGDGPSGGQPRTTGFLAASENPYALDIVLAHAIGLLSGDVEMLRQAIERGLSPDLSDICQTGDSLPIFTDFQKPSAVKNLDFSNSFPLPRFLRSRILRQVTPLPRIRKKDCIGCGKCAESCPAHTIRIENHRACIRYDQCIKCYCCHEMCPVKAIDIQSGIIPRLLEKRGKEQPHG